MKCPYCKEKIRRGAVVCKHCGRDLPSKQIAGQINKRAGLLTILILLGLCFVITTISNALKKAEIARDPVAATINAMDTQTQQARPTATKTITPVPSSTPISDTVLKILMDGIGLNQEEATTTLLELNKIGINQIKSVVFVQESSPLKFFDLDVGYSVPATVSFEEKQLFGVLFGANRVLYDRDAGGVINNISDYTYDFIDEGFYIGYAKEFVKRGLKSPATAKFPSDILERDQYHIWKDHNLVTVKSYVDAQNSFGALIRSTFIVQFELQGDTWNLMYLELDGTVVTGTYKAP